MNKMVETVNLINPYIGLRSFGQKEAHLFFGRETPIHKLNSQLQANKFLAIVGNSGSGKSSIIKAGLLPHLQKKEAENWSDITFRVGNQPIHNLLSACATHPILQEYLHHASTFQETLVKLNTQKEALVDLVSSHLPVDQKLVFVVDQFEELFRFQESGDVEKSETKLFFDLLLQTVQQTAVPLYLIFIIRTDHLVFANQLRGFTELLNLGQYMIPKMNMEQLKEAITKPALSIGVEISTELLERLLIDIGNNEDRLPVLQHALMKTWDYWQQNSPDMNQLDLHHYEAVGGIDKALQLHAEDAYFRLNEKQQSVTQKLFKALTEKVNDRSPTRKPSSIWELKQSTKASLHELEQVVKHFSKEDTSFLVTLGTKNKDFNEETIVDLTHESIIILWKRLNQWVNEEKDSIESYLQLARSAKLYHEGKAGLLKDPELSIMFRWFEQQQPSEAWAERYDISFPRAISFLKNSKQEQDFEYEQSKLRQQNRLKRTRRLAIVLGVISLFSILLFIYTIVKSIQLENDSDIEKKGKQAVVEYYDSNEL